MRTRGAMLGLKLFSTGLETTAERLTNFTVSIPCQKVCLKITQLKPWDKTTSCFFPLICHFLCLCFDYTVCWIWTLIPKLYDRHWYRVPANMQKCFQLLNRNHNSLIITKVAITEITCRPLQTKKYSAFQEFKKLQFQQFTGFPPSTTWRQEAIQALSREYLKSFQEKKRGIINCKG